MVIKHAMPKNSERVEHAAKHTDIQTILGFG